MSHQHDTGYKELFSHPEFVEALLDGFVPPQIRNLLDYASLQSHPGHYITPLFDERIEDAVWSLGFREPPDGQPGVRLYLYILLELQSAPDRRMPLRMLHYSASFYHQLLKERKFTGTSLPAVFPVVLYNGERNWKVARDMQGMVQPMPDFLHYYQPRQGYFLLDVRTCRDSAGAGTDNLLQLVFNVENALTAEDMQRVARELAAGVRNHKDRERIDRVLTRWFKRFLYQNNITIDFEAVDQLQEIPPMLANRVEGWFEEWKRQGLEEGRTQGLAEGRAEGHAQGRAEGVRKLLQLKFGDLPEEVNQRLFNASEAELDLWMERTLSADALDDVFGPAAQ